MTTEILGTEVPHAVIDGLKLSTILRSFDGPLTVSYSRGGERFLAHWCDIVSNRNRWLIVRTTERTLIQLRKRRIDLRSALTTKAVEGFCYLVDRQQDGPIVRVAIIATVEVPDTYLPKSGYILPRKRHVDDWADILLGAEWSADDLATFPKSLGDVYAIAQVMRSTIEFPNMPWRGGWSAVNFMHRARHSVPKDGRLKVGAMALSSPGFIRMVGDSSLGNDVIATTRRYENRKKTIDAHAERLSVFIREKKLNAKEAKVDDPAISSELSDLAQPLLDDMFESGYQHLYYIADGAFALSKIALLMHRRIATFCAFVEDGKVVL